KTYSCRILPGIRPLESPAGSRRRRSRRNEFLRCRAFGYVSFGHPMHGAFMRRRNKLRVCIHFVWATKNRLPLLTEDIERDIYRYIEAICLDNRCSVLAVGGIPDHIHLLAALPSTITLGKIMKEVKGGTSRLVSERLKPGEWFAWQPNYAAFAVSPSH